MAWKRLTEAEWVIVEPLIPKQRMGRPRTRNREILEAILYVLHTGIRWEEIPPGFPPKMTVYDRFRAWVKEGFFDKLFQVLSRKRPDNNKIYYLDSTVKSAKKGRPNLSGRKNKRQQNKPGNRPSRITSRP